MAMTYNILAAPKGTAGSVANWVGYGKLDLTTIIDEAQSLIYSTLRCREMRTEWTFGLSAGQSQIALPDRYLDPCGRVYDVTNGAWIGHKLEGDVLSCRTYEPVSGAFGADPFTTTAGSSIVEIAEPAHNVNQGSTVTIAGAAAVGGLALNGTFPAVGVTDADHFTVDLGDAVAAASITGGGAAATYDANSLVAGHPTRWAVWDEHLKFDLALDSATAFKHLYFRAPALLSAANPSNWLLTRYPRVMRQACQAAAADFMKDDSEYQKGVTALSALIQSIAAEQDLMYRGADIELDIP